jgi:hypothetical protein
MVAGCADRSFFVVTLGDPSADLAPALIAELHHDILAIDSQCVHPDSDQDIIR